MDLFELLRTAFKVVASGLTQNILIIIGMSALLLMVVWGVISLCCNSMVRFSRNCRVMITYLRENTLTKENYSAFIAIMKNFPVEMRFAWKQYETKLTGNAGDYLKKQDCLESPIMGGLQKQNRSLMRTAIGIVVLVLSVFSIAIIGVNTSAGTTNAPLSTGLLADSFIVPLITLTLLMINYYIYTNIRNQEYRTACDYFFDLVDVLNERVDLSSIFAENSRSIGLISNVYTNETLEQLSIEARKRRNNKNVAEVRVGKSSITPFEKGVLGKENNTKMAENVMETNLTPVSNKLSVPNNDIALDTNIDSNFKIRNEVHFVEVVNCVEVLLSRAETETNPVKKQAIEKEVNTLIKALTEYKQKAKKNKKTAKAEDKK